MQKLEDLTENPEEIDLTGLDFGLVEAYLKSVKTGEITPLVKEELKLKIQSRRLAAGQEELPTVVFREPEKPQLTAEEEKKRLRRRERNRVAALKCRKKKKHSITHIEKELGELETRNASLRSHLTAMEREKQAFIEKLNTNRCPSRQLDSHLPVTLPRPPSGPHLPSPSLTFSEPPTCYSPVSCLTVVPPEWEETPTCLLQWLGPSIPRATEDGAGCSNWDQQSVSETKSDDVITVKNPWSPMCIREPESPMTDASTGSTISPTSPLEMRPCSNTSAWSDDNDLDFVLYQSFH